MNFRTKIFLSVALPAAALVSLLAFAAYQFVRTQAESQADLDVARARDSFNRQMKRQIEAIQQSLAPFASTRFTASFEQFNTGSMKREELVGIIDEYRGKYFLRWPLFTWAGPQGESILRQSEGHQNHLCGPGCKHPESIFFGGLESGLVQTEDGFMAATRVPIVDKETEELRGQVVVAVPFEGELRDIAKSSNVELIVWSVEGLPLSTLPGLDPSAVVGNRGEIRHGGMPYRFERIKKDQTILVPLVSMARRDEQIRLILKGAAGMIGLSVLVALVVALTVAQSMAKPVMELEAASRKIGAGDLNVVVDVRSKDEIGKLGAAFNEMVKGLQERAKRAEIMTKMLSSEVSEKLMKEELALTGRKQMASIMFLDVRGFTAMTEGQDAKWVFDMVNECLSRVEKHIRAHGGVVNKYLGDGCMALFGVPESKGNDALNAIEAGRAIQREMAVWSEERKQRGEVIVRIGVGINTDEVLAGNVGSADRMEFTVIGEGVNLASRLCSKAAPGQVLASYVTRRDAGVEGKELEPVHVKGFSMPIRVYEV